MMAPKNAQDEVDMQNNDLETSVKFENDTSHIEGNLKSDIQNGMLAISEAENKRMRRKIHAR